METTYRTSLNAMRIENETKTEGNLMYIEGYACHFNECNHNGEIVDANSFRAFLDEMERAGQKPMMNYMHTDQLIGGWDSIETDDTGLYVKGHLCLDMPFVRDTVLPLYNAGDLCHLSTEGFTPWNTIEEREDGDYLGQFTLTAIALVALPADFSAKANIRNELKAWKESQNVQPQKHEHKQLIY